MNESIIWLLGHSYAEASKKFGVTVYHVKYAMGDLTSKWKEFRKTRRRLMAQMHRHTWNAEGS